jgi:hypothetical protein
MIGVGVGEGVEVGAGVAGAGVEVGLGVTAGRFTAAVGLGVGVGTVITWPQLHSNSTATHKATKIVLIFATPRQGVGDGSIIPDRRQMGKKPALSDEGNCVKL